MKAKTRISSVDSLSDDLWLKIFDTGITGSNFGCDDLSSLSISCKHFDALSKDDELWSSLLVMEFPGSPPPPQSSHSSSSSSSMKSVYRGRLGKEMHDRRASIFEEAADGERQLNLFSRRIELIRGRIITRKNPIRVFVAEIVEVGNRSPVEFHGHLRAINHRVILIDDQVKKLSGGLLHMINFRSKEYGAQPPAIEWQTPRPAFAAPSSPSTPHLNVDITSLEMKADHLVTEHQKFIEVFLMEQCKIQDLLNRQLECDKQLVGLTKRLVFFNTCLSQKVVNVLKQNKEDDDASTPLD